MTDEEVLMKNRDGCRLPLLKHSFGEEKAEILKSTEKLWNERNRLKELEKENAELKAKLDGIRNYLAYDIPHELMNEATNKIWKMI